MTHGALIAAERLRGPGRGMTRTNEEKSQERPRAARGPNLRGRDLRDENLRGARLEGADLRGTDLRGADLRGADLFWARLDGADLRGAALDMARIVEIDPGPLPDDRLRNQIRAFDFDRVMRRWMPDHPDRILPCPYRSAATKPLLYEWGSRSWDGGRGWSPPSERWTLEEIIASVLDGLGCRHDLRRPPIFSCRPRAASG